MQLCHLTEERCACGARTCYEKQDRMHTSGEWFEEKEYVCGKRIKYVPNFRRIEEINPCRRSKKYIAAEKRFDRSIQSILDFIKDNVSERRFNEIRMHIDYMRFAPRDFYDEQRKETSDGQ